MKVLAVKKDSSYLCEVSHTELEKFFNQFYGNLERLKEGQQIDLSKGYDFASEIKQAMGTTKKFITDNQKIITAITNGLILAVRDENEDDDHG